MIQRIQTLYLFLAGLLPAFTFFFPVAFMAKGDSWLTITSISYDTANVSEMAGRHPWGLGVMSVLSVVLAFVALFSYKNRKRQQRWVHCALTCNMVWYLTLVAYSFSVAGRTGLKLSFALCCLLPLVAMISLWMARRAIRHDEALVRAADRIR